ncbi:hypothetical protein I8751_21650 [Nostocaceae cyanobacterium CENA357]|uniref:Uncharacterized protein n=1 Tax=Atlanticothrix silvestris CENA357 TaxID=1725252 RepID=A0A8J7HMC2_9CYAN|nr:hypothetical protein [Atlanticothrix silvestris CENA357]
MMVHEAYLPGSKSKDVSDSCEANAMILAPVRSRIKVALLRTDRLTLILPVFLCICTIFVRVLDKKIIKY